MFETPKDHANWCRDRAFEYLDMGNIRGAFSGIISDMTKGPFRPGKILAAKLVREGPFMVMFKDGAGLRELITEVTASVG